MFFKYTKTDGGFWLQWVLVTLAGFLISLCSIEIDVRPYIKATEGMIGGALVGLAQGIILEQRRKNIAPWWAFMSFVSWGLIGASNLGAVGWMAPRTVLLEPRLLFGLLNGLQVGALLGIGQWLVLRQRCKKSLIWIPIVATSWAIGLVLGWGVGGVLHQVTRLFLSELVGLVVAWVASSAIMGFALVRLDNLYGLEPKIIPNKARY